MVWNWGGDWNVYSYFHCDLVVDDSIMVLLRSDLFDFHVFKFNLRNLLNFYVICFCFYITKFCCGSDFHVYLSHSIIPVD